MPLSTLWFYFYSVFDLLVIWLVMLVLMLYASVLSPVFQQSSEEFIRHILWLKVYLLFWTVLFGLVQSMGTSGISNIPIAITLRRNARAIYKNNLNLALAIDTKKFLN